MKSKRKEVIIIGVLLLLMIVIIVGTSYAAFQYGKTGTKLNVNFNIIITNNFKNKITNII